MNGKSINNPVMDQVIRGILFFADHNPGGDFLYELNKWNPVAQVVNSISAYATGKDTYGNKMSKTNATINLAMAVPIFKIGKVFNVLGSTGRVIAQNLTEQLAMQEIITNPASGMIIKEKLSDPRWYGWTKMTNETAHGVEIHYVAKWENGVIVAVDDFKFID